MILFISGTNVPESYYQRADVGLKQITDVYPDLKDGERYKYNNSTSFILTLSNKKELLGRRNYVAEDNNYILFYSGLPLDPCRRIQAHRAEEILGSFDELKYNFDGQVSIIRFNKNTNNIDIITDILGLEQVYYYQNKDKFLISNSVFLLQKAVNISQLDPHGISYFLSIGWVASDNTLIKDIKVVKGGQHWKWDNKKHQIKKNTYFALSNVKINTKQILDDRSVKILAQKMSNNLSIINENFNIECPLTGGFDSRLIAAYLINENIEAEYYTTGNPASREFQTALLIVKYFNLYHRTNEINDAILIDKWDEYIYKFIVQNDGLSSLWSIPILTAHFDKTGKIKVRLTSQGSEAARVTYSSMDLFTGKIDEKVMSKHLSKRIIDNSNKIINMSANKLGESYLYNFVSSCMEKGLDLRVLPDLFYLKERVGRHVANNWRIEKSKADYFNIFCNKDFLSSAMAISPIYKIIYPLHYKLMKLLNKKLMNIPFYSSSDKKKYGVQNLYYQIYSRKIKDLIKKQAAGIKELMKITDKKNKTITQVNIIPAIDRVYWFKKKLNDIRTIILDQSSSELWFYLNKNEIEKVLLNKEGELINNNNITKLYIISTLFYYDYYNKKLINN